MTAQELKNAILQLAVQGKLVPQNPSDEPAETLLKKIRKEKDKLVREGIIKKEKPLPPIDDEEIPFEIPVGWCWCRLELLYNFIDYRGITPNKISKGIPFITAKNVRQGYIDYSIREFISEEDYNNRQSRGISHKGDILFTTEAPMGYAAIADLEKFSTGQRLITLQQYTGEHLLLNKFYMYVISSRFFQKQLENKCSGTTVKGIKADRLKFFLIPLPPLEEQKRIVAKIEELLPLVEQYGAAEEELQRLNAQFPDQLRKSVLQQAVQGKLVPQNPADGTAEELLKKIRKEKDKLVREGKIKKEKPLPPIDDEEIPFEIPENWVWVRLGEIGTTNIGLTYSPKNIVPIGNGTIVLRSNNIINGKMDYSNLVAVNVDVPANRYCNKGDILICARNGSRKLVGKSAIIDKKGMSFGAFMAIFRSPYNQYINIVLNSPLFRKTFDSDVGTMTINQITQEMLKTFLLPLPPLAEQKRIVEKIESLLPLCDALKQR